MCHESLGCGALVRVLGQALLDQVNKLRAVVVSGGERDILLNNLRAHY